MSGIARFATPDYAVFITMLAITALIGIYYAIKDRKEKNVENYQFGDRQISPIIIGLSLAMSYVSATILLGFPSDVYVYGTIILWYGTTNFIPMIISGVYYVPLIQKLKLHTMNQFLEYRFNSKVRKFSSFYTLITSPFIMGLSMYVPPLALEAVTPLSFNASVLITTGIVTFYTAIGGFKAVVWSDVMQGLIMFAGAIAVLIRAVIVVGGFEEMWEAVDRGGRTTHWNFNLDPTIQRTFWTIFVGQTFSRIGLYSSSQPALQRVRSCKSIKDARTSFLISLIPILGFFVLCILIGSAVYTFFEECDPVRNGEIRTFDQLLPLMVSKIFADAPGMTGLFVAAVYSGTLSNISSSINSCGTLIVQDLVVAFHPRMSQSARTTISKITAFGLGIIVAALAFAYQFVGGTVITLSFTILGCFSGPSIALVTLAMFCPWANATGAVSGTIIGLAINLWIAISAIIYGIPPEKRGILPFLVSNCTSSINQLNSTLPFDVTSAMAFASSSVTYPSETTLPYESEKPSLYYSLYAMSFQYYSVLGFVVCMIFGLLISFLTKPNSPSELDPKLFVPLVDNKYLPQKVRKFFRFGVREDWEQEKYDEYAISGSQDIFEKKQETKQTNRLAEYFDTKSKTISTKL